MSILDLRGSKTRVDRSDPLDEVLKDPTDPVVRRMRTGSLIVAALLLVPFAWLRDDHDETRTMLEAVIAEYEASPTL
ncbi:MAG TPA: hypothetical protein VMM35_09540, partial [Longimicrobiales bacterium]|nr:hypothetical protein [Longimicrobiales bacterium]